MYYRHNLNYEYPERSDQHMIKVKHLRDVVLDENYPYLQKGFKWWLQRASAVVLYNCVLTWLVRITHGLRVHGRENLKKHKEALKDGAITVCNHVFEWDTICISIALRNRKFYFPAWAGNLEGPNGPLIRMAGGIPIPESIKTMKVFKAAMEEVFATKTWVHYFPEAAMWYFYPDIRPFKKSAFQQAVKYNRPIVPMVYSFRPRKGITKWFTDKPCADIHIGEPLFPDPNLTPMAAAKKLLEDSHHIMQVMAGITPDHPAYSTEQNPAEYKSTM